MVLYLMSKQVEDIQRESSMYDHDVDAVGLAECAKHAETEQFTVGRVKLV